MPKYKHILIRFCLGGAIVRIGCERVPFINREELKKAFCDYLDDPEATEKKWLENDWRVVGDDQTVIKEVV